MGVRFDPLLGQLRLKDSGGPQFDLTTIPGYNPLLFQGLYNNLGSFEFSVPVDQNTSRDDNTLWIMTGGDDLTGTRGDKNLPYATYAGAMVDYQEGDLVSYGDGDFSTDIIDFDAFVPVGQFGVGIYLSPGAIVGDVVASVGGPHVCTMVGYGIVANDFNVTNQSISIIGGAVLGNIVLGGTALNTNVNFRFLGGSYVQTATAGASIINIDQIAGSGVNIQSNNVVFKTSVCVGNYYHEGTGGSYHIDLCGGTITLGSVTGTIGLCDDVVHINDQDGTYSKVGFCVGDPLIGGGKFDCESFINTNNGIEIPSGLASLPKVNIETALFAGAEGFNIGSDSVFTIKRCLMAGQEVDNISGTSLIKFFDTFFIGEPVFSGINNFKFFKTHFDITNSISLGGSQNAFADCLISTTQAIAIYTEGDAYYDMMVVNSYTNGMITDYIEQKVGSFGISPEVNLFLTNP